MPRQFAILTLFPVFLMACGGPEQPPAVDPTPPPADWKADMAWGDECPRRVYFDWVEKDGDREITSDRIRGLNRYAAEKLESRQCEIDQTLLFRGIDPLRVAPITVYRIEVGNQQHCMDGGWLLASFDLESDVRYQNMKTQVDNTVEFLKRFHEDTNGMGTVLFDTVILCPKSWYYWGQEFALSGPNLAINLPSTGWEGFWTFDARELRDQRWTPGEHFNQWQDRKTIKRVWPLLDPAGSVRHALRSGIADRVRGLISRLLSFDWNINGQQGDLETIRTRMIGMVGDQVTSGATTDGGDNLEDAAVDRLLRSDREQLKCIAEVWMDYLEDPTRIHAASEAAVAVTCQEAARNRFDVDVKQNGAIVIGNTHLINVNLNVFLSSGYQDLEEYVEVVESDQNINWSQNGLVVVYTIDDVNVNVKVSANRAVQTAGLKEALELCR